jgi:hypothetical protein
MEGRLSANPFNLRKLWIAQESLSQGDSISYLGGSTTLSGEQSTDAQEYSGYDVSVHSKCYNLPASFNGYTDHSSYVISLG